MDLWTYSLDTQYIPFDPPPGFRDKTIDRFVEKFAIEFIKDLLSEAFETSCKMMWSIPCSQECHMSSDPCPPKNSTLWNGFRLYWTPEVFATSKHSSALSSCLSTSHNSLATISSGNMDVSDHIKSAISHDVLTAKHISDTYNVPFDSDIYSLPVDVVHARESKKTDLRASESYCHSFEYDSEHCGTSEDVSNDGYSSQKIIKRNKEVESNSATRFCSKASCSTSEPIHVTVDDVRQYLKNFYVNSNEAGCNRNLHDTLKNLKKPFRSLQNCANNNNNNNQNNLNNEENSSNGLKCWGNYIGGGKSEKTDKTKINCNANSKEKYKKWSAIKDALCNLFRLKRLSSPNRYLKHRGWDFKNNEIGMRLSNHEDLNPPSPITKPPFSKRALPPLPGLEHNHGDIIVTDSTPLPSPEEMPPSSTSYKSKKVSGSIDFASSIEKVKDCGWYWGPISGEAAEKILSNEPDGSFIVRDSSDDYYIFSLTFKLNSIIRHVRIEHDKGNFSFGSFTRFKSHTIVDFIESAVEHSRSGRYLFFLHHRPVLGPMRVQLLHPVSRFKQVQSLQHMCRFVILKMVRKDLIQYLPLPRRILDYLSTQHYYWDTLAIEDQSNSSTREIDSQERFWPLERERFS